MGSLARRAILTPILAGVVLSCSGDGGPTGPLPVASVTLSPSPASVRVGETLQLNVSPKDRDGNTLSDRVITWASADASIASVANGTVTGHATGATQVSAVADGVAGTVDISVTPARITRIDVRPSPGELLVGESLQLTATPIGVGGTPLTDRTVAWSSGDPGVATVSASGIVSGVSGGQVVITASADQESGSATVTVVDPTAPRVSAVTPYPLVVGASATLTGINFGATIGENAVTVDGFTGSVTAASATSITFTVPDTGCRPHRDVQIRVTAGGKSGTTTHPLRPSAFTQVGIGDQVVLSAADARCIQLDAAGSFQSYLVGVQSTSGTATDLTDFELVSRTGSTTSAAGVSLALLAPGTPASATTFRSTSSSEALGAISIDASLPDPESMALLRGHAARHLDGRLAEGALLASGALDFSAAAAGALVGPIPGDAVVGDQFQIRVPSHFPGSCTAFNEVTAELRLITDRGYWLVDTANPAGGYDADDLRVIAGGFEGSVAPTLEGTFGAIPDTDGEPRIAFVATVRVNDQGWLSYASLYDYLPRSGCEASNEGDFAYLATPVPLSSFAVEGLLDVMGHALAHDFTHVIQNRAVIAGGDRADAWIEEGQATLGEELYAHAIASPARSPRQNYGAAVIFSGSAGGYVQPYSMVSGLAYLFGFDGSNGARVAEAPHECTWVSPNPGGSSPGPCSSGASFSGSWAFLRWLTDHYGAVLGGDDVLLKGLIDTPGSGFDRVATLTGVPTGTLLARFAASLYVDDRTDLVEPTLAFPSWNLSDMHENMVANAQLQPTERGFDAFATSGSVRAASTAYYLISDSGRPATALELTGPSGAPAGADVQLWAVRLQ